MRHDMPSMADTGAFLQTQRCASISVTDAFLIDTDRNAISDTNAILTKKAKKQDNNGTT